MSTLLPVLALVLVGSQVVARLATRLRLPAVFGELALGLALGPFILNWLHDGGQAFDMLGNLGVLFLMLLVGLETDLSAFAQVGLPAFLVATFGALLPFGAGAAVVIWLHEPLATALFIGVGLSATSVSITAAALRGLGKLQTRAGRTILMAAVIDDVIGLLLLAFVTSGESGGGASPLLSLLRLGAVAAIMLASTLVIKPTLRLLRNHIEGFLAFAVGVGLFYAWLAQALGGLAPITGAYIAGVLLAHAAPQQRLAQGVESLASGFFASIFFVSLGLHVQIASVNLTLLGILMGLALLTKLVGCGLGALVGRLSPRDALVVGVGMIPRGEVALIVASLGYQGKFLSAGLFSALVLVAAGTTLITPPLLTGALALVRARQPVVELAPASEMSEGEGALLPAPDEAGAQLGDISLATEGTH